MSVANPKSVIGNWLAQGGGRRDKILLATKVAMEMGPGEKGLSRDHILRAVEASLRRLKTDRIDLYQSHTPDETVPIEETLRAYEELIASGKVRAIGASNYSPRRSSSRRSMRARRTDYHATRRCSPGTISMIARIMRLDRKASASSAGWASFPISAWRADS